MNEIDGDDKVRLGMVAIGSACCLMALALFLGHDGQLLAATLGLIGAITGGIIGFGYKVVKEA